jgi:hypothetical protein
MFADLNMKEVLKLNHNIDPNNLKEGSTIILPMGKLSARDRQILDGMRAGNYRTYPVRKGETLEDILGKRKITMDEFKALNPDVNVKKIKGVPLALQHTWMQLMRNNGATISGKLESFLWEILCCMWPLSVIAPVAVQACNIVS